ncbi:MAG TPA: AMP-binding protein [Ilumatobacteraceae bacterium]|nr:AMP-binding protein [Ilumatobacteraceae bacterium]
MPDSSAPTTDRQHQNASSVRKELIFHRLLLPAAKRNADRPCTTDAATGATHTYREHFDEVARAIGGLRALGVDRGDRFALMMANSPEYLVLFHAALLGGGVVNPLNLRFAPKELAYVLRDSGSTVCFVDQHFAPIIDQVKEEAGLEHVVLVGDGDAPHTLRYGDLLASATPVIPDEGDESDPVVLMYTGGTTGLPKGVLSDQRGQVMNAYHCLMTLPYERGSSFLLQTPMFHAASTLTMTSLPAAGGHIVTIPMFEPVAVMRALREHQPTFTVMVPTMIGMTLSHPDFTPDALASLTDIGYGASPMPQVLLEKLAQLYPELDLWQVYGMTEASPVLTVLRPEDHRTGGALLRSAGSAVTGVELSIRDVDGSALPVGVPGEVCARGGNYMIGYWNKPEATAEAFAGGWYHSGDAGYLDDDGYLYLVDRVKDMIVTGGENVYSAEVENAIASHPAVLQVAVIGVPSDEWGEAVHAIVVLREGAEATDVEIIDHAREYIAGYKVPKAVTFRSDPLPLSGAMKVLKRELRAPYWEGHDRNVG